MVEVKINLSLDKVVFFSGEMTEEQYKNALESFSKEDFVDMLLKEFKETKGVEIAQAEQRAREMGIVLKSDVQPEDF